MMKFINLKFFIILLFSSLTSFVSSQEMLTWEDRPFSVGEELVYCVYYNWQFVWIPAGEVRFEIMEKGDSCIFHVTGSSYYSYDSFFKVRDDYISYIDKEAFLPIHFRRDILEGNYQRFDSISFDNEKQVLTEFFGHDRASAKKYVFEMEEQVLDMITAIYYMRSHDLTEIKIGDNIPVNIFFDKEKFDVNIKYLGEKKKKIKDIGKVKVKHLQPELIDGYVFKKGDLMDIWVSNDENKIPLLIESPITFGSVKAILTSAKKLKYPSNYLQND